MRMLERTAKGAAFDIVKDRKTGEVFAVFDTPEDAFAFDCCHDWVFIGCPITDNECAFNITEMYRRPN